MRRKLAKAQYTTARRDFLAIMEESYLFGTRKETRLALQGAATAWRAWMLGMTKAPPKGLETKLRIPGCGTLSICWYEYGGRFAPRVKLRFRPNKDINRRIRRVNRQSQIEWEAKSQEGTSGMDPKGTVVDDTAQDEALVG